MRTLVPVASAVVLALATTSCGSGPAAAPEAPASPAAWLPARSPRGWVPVPTTACSRGRWATSADRPPSRPPRYGWRPSAPASWTVCCRWVWSHRHHHGPGRQLGPGLPGRGVPRAPQRAGGHGDARHPHRTRRRGRCRRGTRSDPDQQHRRAGGPCSVRADRAGRGHRGHGGRTGSRTSCCWPTRSGSGRRRRPR